MMECGLDQDIENEDSESEGAKTPTRFTLNPQETTSNSQSKQTRQSNFVKALEACKRDPQISINKLDSLTPSEINTPSPFGTNPAGGFPMAFLALRADDSPCSPNQKRDRAKTFNQDDSLTITKYPTALVDGSTDSNEGKKNPFRPDCNKKLLSHRDQ